MNQQVEAEPDGEPHADDREAVRRIAQAEKLDRAGERGGRIHVHRRRSPDYPHQLVEKQDEPECCQHLVEMVAAIEAHQRDALDDDAEHHRRGNGDQPGQHERFGPAEYGGREIRAHHVKRAVREIHEIHDPEHERQPGGQQEQQNAELQAVQRLREEEADGHGRDSQDSRRSCARGNPASFRRTPLDPRLRGDDGLQISAVAPFLATTSTRTACGTRPDGP